MKIMNARLRVVASSLLLVASPLALSAYAEDHTVNIQIDAETGGFVFAPNILHIAPGDTVVWVNKDSGLHNVVSYPDRVPEGADGFWSPMISEVGQSFRVTFEVAGTYGYHCIPHVFLDMTGSIMVGDAEATAYHTPSTEEKERYKEGLLQFYEAEDLSYMPEDVVRNLPDGEDDTMSE